MSKLTGGQDTPSPGLGLQHMLSRSNTVTGVERSAARNAMFKRLGNRTPLKESGESEVTSGGDDPPQALDSSSSEQVSKHPSPTISNAVIDDREPPSPSNSPPLSQSFLPPPGVERQHETRLNGEVIHPYDLHPSRGLPVRGLVIEENDDDDDDDTPLNGSSAVNPRAGNGLRSSSSRAQPASRYPPLSEIPSTISSTSTHSNTERVPVFLQGKDTFPVTISPATTPVREKEKGLRDEDEDGEKVVYLYPEETRDRKPVPNRLDSNVSWVGDDLGINLNLSEATKQQTSQPTQRLISDEEDIDDQIPSILPQETDTVEITHDPDPELGPKSAPPPQPASQEDLTVSQIPFPNSDADEGNPSRETSPSAPPETPKSDVTFSNASASEKPSSRADTPAVNRTSLASSSSLAPPAPVSPPVRLERGVSETYTDFEEIHTDKEGFTDRESSHRIERSPSHKKRESGGTTSRWDRMRNALTGRRSRSNSFARARKDEKTETGASRESGASVKTDNGASQLPQPPAHTAAGSRVALTTGNVPPPREGLSPVPPISPAGLAWYANPKLTPLPGLIQLEQEQRRLKGNANTTNDPTLIPGTVPATRVNTPEPGLAHQSSDSRLIARYRRSGENTGTYTDVEDTDHEGGRITPGFFDISSSMPPTPSTKQSNLPQTKEAALRWLTQRKKEGKLQHSHSGASNGHISDTGTVRQAGRRKPSLTDLLDNVGADPGTEREIDRTSSATPRASSRRKAMELLRKMAGTPTTDPSSPSYTISTASNHSVPPLKSPAQSPTTPLINTNGHTHSYSSTTSSTSIPRPTTPSSHPQQSSPLSSQAPKPSPPSAPVPSPRPSNAPFVLGRMDSLLNDPTSSSGVSAFGDPPRHLVHFAIVRQIVSPNEVKNRVLLLFNDLLVIAKFSDEDADRPILDRLLVVRNILELSQLTVQLDSEMKLGDFMQLASIESLTKQFPINPDDAINRCLEQAQLSKDPALLACAGDRTAGWRTSPETPSDNSGTNRPATPGGSQISARDFLYAFRLLDPHRLVTDDLLQKIYISIRNEGLVQALDRAEHVREIPCDILPSGLPGTLTTRVSSHPVVFRIPNPDPHLRVHLHGQDLFFDPPILEFSRTCEVSCIVTGTTLGTKDMVIVRTGANAAKYSMPLKTSIRVERSFMQNTLTVGFTTSEGVKRRYKFNFSGDEECSEWGASLKRFASEAAVQSGSQPNSSRVNQSGSSAEAIVQRASRILAMQSLRKALVGPGSRTLSNSSAAPASANGPEPGQIIAPMIGQDLVTTCLQNSLVPAVLSHLQVTRRGADTEPKSINVSRVNGRI
ncbi:uncharacterized protein EI90DRAFT_3127765 [Cantharellus anzutake]|uniref:uncharacterized protein n=1 Tax=Cantharellus anzutake TaxID=1750568 RepID=UPI001904D1BF|nr:uncharacterized protein EI90DRAFT_3127765 [Cantharellus anzutake]KAF8326566.1 hypothetical protein EI90DRAFT_3127765 [Cantharellus anzutake]